MTLQTIDPQSPFDPENVDSDRARGGRLPRPLMLGCGILLLLFGIGLVAFMFKGEAVMRHLLAWSLDSVQSEVMAALPKDLTAAERDRLQQAFDSASKSVRESKHLDVKALQTLQPELMDVSRSLGKGTLTRDQCLKLAASLEALAGSESPQTTPESPSKTPEAEPKAPDGSTPPAAPSDDHPGRATDAVTAAA